ncbi:MAG: molecular chaperone GrpE [Campylobacterota bacterium]|nr:molecular chaperone GrpE [Campylobacterota bacterium]
MSQEKENFQDEKAPKEQNEIQEEMTQEDLLAQTQALADEYKDKYLRAHADFENSKKRLEKDKANAIAFANEGFAKDLLAVIDSFENALTSIEGVDEENTHEVLEKMKEGVKLTYEQLKKVLEKNSIKEIGCEGVFDPEIHQVIMQVESQGHQSNEIVQVMQKGYTLKERVLRPAMVSVAK